MKQHVVCEAYPQYRNHIRQASLDALKPTGGLKDVALCGFQFEQGWDKPGFQLTRRYAKTMKSGNGIRYCDRCVELYLEAE